MNIDRHYFYLARDNRRPRFWIVGLFGCGSGCSSCCGSGGCGCSCCCSSSSLGQIINWKCLQLCTFLLKPVLRMFLKIIKSTFHAGNYHSNICYLFWMSSTVMAPLSTSFCIPSISFNSTSIISIIFSTVVSHLL